MFSLTMPAIRGRSACSGKTTGRHGARRAGEKDFRLAQELKAKAASGDGSVARRAAELCVYLASPESDGITGKLISAMWDPWPDLAHHSADLEKTDVYTLRRIVGADRGLEWGKT